MADHSSEEENQDDDLYVNDVAAVRVGEAGCAASSPSPRSVCDGHLFCGVNCHRLCSASIHYHFTPCFPLPLLESKSPNSGKSQKAKLPYMGKHVSSCLFPGNPCLQRYNSFGARLQTTLVTRDVQCYYVGVAWIVNSQLQCFYGVPLGERENLMTVIK